MAESDQISRKRMRVSSSSATDRVAPAASLSGKILSKVTRTYPRVTIKDLRHRRVFSPTSISSEWGFKTKEQQHDGSNIGKEGNTMNASDSEVEDCIEATPPVRKSGATPCSKSLLLPCSRAKIFKNPGSFSYKRLLPYLMQAADDGKPSELCSKPDKSSGHCYKEADDLKEELMTAKIQLPVLQPVDRVSNQPLAGSTSPLKRVTVSSPNKKPVSSRRKLFKTPGSVNYRRMLPYLRETQVDNPCVPETNHSDHQKNKEENTSSSMLVSENEGIHETVTSIVARESDTCSNEDKEPLLCECVSVSPEPSDSDKEQEAQVKHVILDTEKNLESPRDVLGSEVPSSPPPVGSRNSSEVASSPLNNTCDDTLAAEEHMCGAEKTEAKNSTEELEAVTLDITAELLDPSDILTTPSSISPSKGILKRSIRGCRGICSCLNCSSFRLNAERAFEFSRNQLQDTEVMVLDLVGEISHLKDMLEKYATADHSDSYKSEAGEAAKGASEAAELAKSRLHQMNDNLQVHCRIPNEQRARVKFAHYVQEKTILKASEVNKLISSPF